MAAASSTILPQLTHTAKSSKTVFVLLAPRVTILMIREFVKWSTLFARYLIIKRNYVLVVILALLLIKQITVNYQRIPPEILTANLLMLMGDVKIALLDITLIK
jgi:hypothetical protein